jgi:hypothetical protein
MCMYVMSAAPLCGAAAVCLCAATVKRRWFRSTPWRPRRLEDYGPVDFSGWCCWCLMIMLAYVVLRYDVAECRAVYIIPPTFAPSS